MLSGQTDPCGGSGGAETVSRVFSLYGVKDNYRQVLHEEGHGFDDAQREIAYRFMEDKL